jgi:hypothetical protein
VKICASLVKPRELSEHQPQRRGVMASTSPSGEL